VCGRNLAPAPATGIITFISVYLLDQNTIFFSFRKFNIVFENSNLYHLSLTAK
jgi:hypothetical protein